MSSRVEGSARPNGTQRPDGTRRPDAPAVVTLAGRRNRTGVLVVSACGAEGLAAALGEGGIDVLGHAAEARDAARLAAERQPQVVVVDLDDDPEALVVIDSIVTAVPQIPILALTGRHGADRPGAGRPDHAAVLAVVRAGATGVIVASILPDVVGARPAATGHLGPDLVDAVLRTARGEAVFSPGLADVVLEAFGRPATTPVDPTAAASRLTERESDVLRLVVDGLTARQIATRLGLSPRTVENHVQSVLRKLSLHSRAALVRYAMENGLA